MFQSIGRKNGQVSAQILGILPDALAFESLRSFTKGSHHTFHFGGTNRSPRMFNHEANWRSRPESACRVG